MLMSTGNCPIIPVRLEGMATTGTAPKQRETVNVDGHRLRLTSLDKVLYPETGTTKADVLSYYAAIAPTLIPYAHNRPATRKRWVNGVGTPDDPGQVFFQKNIDDPYSVTLERAIELITEKREAEKNKVINVFAAAEGEMQVLNGFYGPYIAYNGKNYRIAKGTDAKSLTQSDCEEIIKNSVDKPAKRRTKKS